MCGKMYGIVSAGDSHVSLTVQSFLLFLWSVDRHGTPMRPTFVTQSLALTKVELILMGNWFHHQSSDGSREDPARIKAPRYRQVPLSGRASHGLRDDLRRLSQEAVRDSTLFWNLQGLNTPDLLSELVTEQSLTRWTEFWQQMLPFRLVLNGCPWHSWIWQGPWQVGCDCMKLEVALWRGWGWWRIFCWVLRALSKDRVGPSSWSNCEATTLTA